LGGIQLGVKIVDSFEFVIEKGAKIVNRADWGKCAWVSGEIQPAAVSNPNSNSYSFS